MFLSPKIWGCKYTNNFLFINKKAVFQHFGVLITYAASDLLHLFLLFSFLFLLSSFLLSLSSFPLLLHFLSPPSTTFLLHIPFFIFLSPYPFLHIPFLHLLSFCYILSLPRFRSLPILLLRHIPLIHVPTSYGPSPSDRHHPD